MRTKLVSIDGTDYKIHGLNRGQVRTISGLTKEQEIGDQLVLASLQITEQELDALDMVAYTELIKEIIDFNGMNVKAVEDAKKN